MTLDQPAYCELAVQSNFSFLRGASRPEELVSQARALGHSAMGLADRNTVAGVVRAWSRSKILYGKDGREMENPPYHPGCRLVFADGTPDILAYPRDRRGWGHLCRLLTQANFRDESPKGDPKIYRTDLFEWGENISLAIIPTLTGGREAEDLELISRLSDRFGRSAIWIAVSPAYGGDDGFRFEQAAAIAAAKRVPLMAINDVLYHAAERRALQDIVTAIRLNTPVAKSGFALGANAERYLKASREMARLFRRHPDAIGETMRFAETLSFSLRELSHNYPEETSTPGVDPQEELERLTWHGARKRYPDGFPPNLAERIREELAIVANKEYARYFLTVHDIVRFAREKANILCQGRGSAANSVICYCLGVTEVDPILTNGLFARFMSTERDEPPDIDVDFEHEKREQVIAYIYGKYSNERTALAASVVTYRGRSAVREVAKAMGLSNDVQTALSSSIWGWWSSSVGEREARAGGIADDEAMRSHVMERANELMHIECPRHLSQHVGGFVITKDRLDEIVPIMRTGMEERKMVEWDKDDLDAVGLIKVDILALGMLSCLKRAFDLLKYYYGRDLTLESMPKEDPDVYDMICRADTLGVFQIESRAQMSMLPRLQPRKFYDLVIEVAIVRPGPIQGNMVHPYLKRRMKKEPIEYPSPEIAHILERTLGVPLFQEQAMGIAIVAAGFSPARADKLRRAMATFKRGGQLQELKEEFIQGMRGKGYSLEFAERVFKQIEGFGEYGFPESHAASFALLVYASCWFKTFYPDVFCAAILNSQPMGFYAPAQLVRDAQDHGIDVRPVDVNRSDWNCTLEAAPFEAGKIIRRHAEMRDVILTRHAVRLGFRQIKGLSEKRMREFVDRRGAGYISVRDLWLRSGLDAADIQKLAEADAFRSMGLDRRNALWAVKALDGKSAAENLPLFDRAGSVPDLEPATQLPIMKAGDHVLHDYRTLGLSLKSHPVAFLRERLDRSGVTPNERLPFVADGARVTVAGVVLVRQRPGKGNAIFLTLEDEKAVANIIVWARDFERFRPVIMGSRFIRVSGKLQSESGVVHIVARKMDDLTSWLADLSEEALFRRRLEEAGQASGLENAPPGSPEKLMPKGRNFH